MKSGETVEKMPQVDVDELSDIWKKNSPNILDVRKESEFESEHVQDVQNLPLDFIWSRMHEINPKETYYVHCKGGYRSVIAYSILRNNGFNNLIDVAGGFDALLETDIPKTEYVCPSTEL